MPFEKGKSGNPKGRPRQTAEQKSQKEQFQRLLKSSTVDALQSIIQIANDRYKEDINRLMCAMMRESKST